MRLCEIIFFISRKYTLTHLGKVVFSLHLIGIYIERKTVRHTDRKRVIDIKEHRQTVRNCGKILII